MADAQAHTSTRSRTFTSGIGLETAVAQWGLALFVGIVVRLYVVWANEMDSGDWVGRTIRAGEFVRGAAPIWARTPWPEGNYLLPAIPIALGGDSYWSVRVICALFAALAIPLICLLGRQFGGLQGGRAAAWIVALLPFHVYISANGAMTEGPFLVFVLAAIVGAVRWAEKPSRTRWLLAAGLCVAAAEAFRFDGVLVGASIGLVALFVRDERGLGVRQPRILGAIALFGLIALVYPIALYLSWKHFYGDPLYMVKFAEENTTQFYSDGGHQRWPRWFYILYCITFWPVVGPVFALTPLIWAVSWLGVWRARASIKTWILVVPIVALTVFYMRAALSYTLLNQIRYVTVLSLPLLACFWIPIAALTLPRRRLALGAGLATMVALQIVPTDAAWHDRGVLTRQLAPYSLVRPKQHVARDVLRWIDQHASPGQKVVFSPHAGSAWLTLASHSSEARIQRLNVYRTSNLVHDSAGMVSAIRDSLRGADWLVTSGKHNTEGLRDALVEEMVIPTPSTSGGALIWQGVHLRLTADFGAMRVYAIGEMNQATESHTSTSPP